MISPEVSSIMAQRPLANSLFQRSRLAPEVPHFCFRPRTRFWILVNSCIGQIPQRSWIIGFSRYSIPARKQGNRQLDEREKTGVMDDMRITPALRLVPITGRQFAEKSVALKDDSRGPPRGC